MLDDFSAGADDSRVGAVPQARDERAPGVGKTPEERRRRTVNRILILLLVAALLGGLLLSQWDWVLLHASLL